MQSSAHYPPSHSLLPSAFFPSSPFTLPILCLVSSDPETERERNCSGPAVNCSQAEVTGKRHGDRRIKENEREKVSEWEQTGKKEAETANGFACERMRWNEERENEREQRDTGERRRERERDVSSLAPQESFRALISCQKDVVQKTRESNERREWGCK